jgi:hypothetical protein
MNLLDKFSAVDIKAETRISNSDKQFCEVQQAAYNHGRNALKQILDISERFIKEQNDILGAIDREVYSNYIYDGREGVSLHSIHELLRKSHRTFISKIVSHFSSAYHVELDSSAVVDNLVPHEPRYSNEKDAKEYTEQIENMDVSYDQVLDQIFVQLGGFSFHDKAINEMKEKCHEAAWNRYYGKRVYEQKKSVLSFTGYGCSFDSWHEQWHKGEYEIKLTDGMKEIIRALAYFEYGEIGYIPYAFNCLLGWSWTTTETERRFDMEKLKSIKCFKNGRVDVRFTSEAYARQFAEEFLGTEAY